MRTNTNLVHLAIFQAIGFVDWPEPCLMLNLYKQNCLVILEGTSFMYHSIHISVIRISPQVAKLLVIRAKQHSKF